MNSFSAEGEVKFVKGQARPLTSDRLDMATQTFNCSIHTLDAQTFLKRVGEEGVFSITFPKNQIRDVTLIRMTYGAFKVYQRTDDVPIFEQYTKRTGRIGHKQVGTRKVLKTWFGDPDENGLSTKCWFGTFRVCSSLRKKPLANHIEPIKMNLEVDEAFWAILDTEYKTFLDNQKEGSE